MLQSSYNIVTHLIGIAENVEPEIQEIPFKKTTGSYYAQAVI